ncbi:MAG: membrane integrity-associated transporter subunit PqiC [Deltaproteobacteria bacterium]|nr:membrane integrity-associated transporter subunit PqiC [Deltaproteobacteria bacterium]
MIRSTFLSILLLGMTSCSLPFSGEPALRRYFALETVRAVTPSATPIEARLLIRDSDGVRLSDTHSIVFSRDARELASYQYASWVEPPADQISHLIYDAFQASNMFTVVSRSTSGVVGDLQLNIEVKDFFYDLSGDPDVVKIRIGAELLNLRDRSVLASREFIATKPVDDEGVEYVVAGFGAGATELISSLVTWVGEQDLQRIHPPRQ